MTNGTDYRVRLDYPYRCAEIIDSAGRTVAHYSDVAGRDDAQQRIARDGWHLAPGGAWTYSSPPDGREHPVHYQPGRHRDPPAAHPPAL